MNDPSRDDTPALAQDRFGAGFEDVVIVPLVLIAVAARHLFKATLSILIHILDYAFPILLQLVRFPLFTASIIGDGIAALVRGIVGCLPISGMKRDEWREAISRRWSWLRQKISYRAFEHAVHHAFERGMAWVFRTCRTLTPRTALLVIAGAALWLPVSFGVSTVMHAILIAKATSWPAWMQLLHPFATIIAKSKLLVLPAYPAAWPQAKQHPFVQTIFQSFRYLASLRVTQKTGYRYRQTECAFVLASDALRRAASLIGLGWLSNAAIAVLNSLAAWIGTIVRAIMTGTIAGLSRLPLSAPIISRYAAHYDRADQKSTERFSEKATGFFDRWSIKLSPEYYEAREKDQAAARGLRA